MSDADKFKWKFAALLIVIAGVSASIRLFVEMTAGMPLNSALIAFIGVCALAVELIGLLVVKR